MIKGSAIVAIITVFDLMGETRLAFSRTFDFQTYIWAALIYLVDRRDRCAIASTGSSGGSRGT